MPRILTAAGRQLAGWILLALLSAAPVFAHEGHSHQKGAPAQQEPVGQVGVDERLGGKIPLGLTFRDEAGQERRLSELISGPTIILPVYYRCSNVCNDLQWELTRVLPSVGRTPGTDYRVLSVSIDETETRQMAASSGKMYLDKLGKSFPIGGWHFLTGDKAAIQGLMGAAGYSFQRRGAEFMHPVACFVVTADGTIVRYLYGTNFLAKDLTLAFIEAGQGKVGTSVKKLVNYCFSFDPQLRSYQFNLLRVSATVVILCCGTFLSYLLFTGRKGKRRLSGGK
jgi:protein SCO1/2